MDQKIEPAQQVDNRPRLATERLLLRPFYDSDEEDLFLICREKEIAATTRTIPHPYPREQARHWIDQHPARWKDGKAAVFAICRRTEKQLVGSIGLEIDEENQNAELGYLIDKRSWGQGYGTEAAAAVLHFGFETLALNRIHAHCLTTNPASARLLEKIGLKKEGLLRGHVRKWGQFYDVAFFGLLRSEYS